MQLLDLFKVSKLVEFRDGGISLMKTPVNIMPTSVLCSFQHGLINAEGMGKAYEIMYEEVKKGSREYNEAFIKSQNFTEKHKIIDWQTKIVSLSGWGNIVVALIDFDKNRFVTHFNNSTFARAYKNAYGRQKQAVDFIATGFVAGGLSAAAGRDLDAVETSCIARGDSTCEIEVGAPDVIAKTRKELWKKWGVA